MRETERHTETETQRGRDTERQRQRETEKEREAFLSSCREELQRQRLEREASPRQQKKTYRSEAEELATETACRAG